MYTSIPLNKVKTVQIKFENGQFIVKKLELKENVIL